MSFWYYLFKTGPELIIFARLLSGVEQEMLDMSLTKGKHNPSQQITEVFLNKVIKRLNCWQLLFEIIQRAPATPATNTMCM